MNKKKTLRRNDKLIKAVYVSYVYGYIFCTSWSGRLEYNSLDKCLCNYNRRVFENKALRRIFGPKRD